MISTGAKVIGPHPPLTNLRQAGTVTVLHADRRVTRSLPEARRCMSDCSSCPWVDFRDYELCGLKLE